MKVFLDTNVLVSAFATRGLCADLLRLVIAEHELLVGEVVLDELRRVLRQRIRLPSETVDDIEELLREYSIVPAPLKPASMKLRDPDDRWIVASALDGGADVLVTGDQDLLVATAEAPVRITDPRGLWTSLRGTRSSR